MVANFRQISTGEDELVHTLTFTSQFWFLELNAFHSYLTLFSFPLSLPFPFNPSPSPSPSPSLPLTSPQVHGFCCTLVENSLSFGSQSRTEDVSSLRIITTEVPALLSAAEVMITQSHKRTQDLEGQKKMSMQRSSDLQLLGATPGGAMGVKKRGPPPKPPAAPEKEEEVKL